MPFVRLLIALAAGLALITGCAGTPAAPTAVPVTEYVRPDLLVDTAWVRERLDDPSVRLIDLSGKPETYAAGHLPGAVYVNLSADLTDPNDPVKGQILQRDALSALFSRLGIRADDTLVLYDDARNLLAARAYWVLKYYQHRDVRIYNGGSVKWVADGAALVTDAPAPVATQYAAAEPDAAIRTTWDDVVAAVEDPSALFCDARGPKEYSGEDLRSARGGHIPGAINVDWTSAVAEDGTFRSASELSALYARAGFTPDKTIITYCQTGVRGAHTWFVLRELLGYPNVRNYDGSWEEYGNRQESTIEQ